MFPPRLSIEAARGSSKKGARFVCQPASQPGNFLARLRFAAPRHKQWLLFFSLIGRCKPAR